MTTKIEKNLKMNPIKILSIILMIVVIANFVLLILGMIGTRGFWMILIVIAVFAYLILPKLKKKLQ